MRQGQQGPRVHHLDGLKYNSGMITLNPDESRVLGVLVEKALNHARSIPALPERRGGRRQPEEQSRPSHRDG